MAKITTPKPGHPATPKDVARVQGPVQTRIANAAKNGASGKSRTA